MTLPVVILAGGEGRRMGGGKPQRLLGGCSLLDHALMTARRWSACIAVCVRSPGQVIPDTTRILLDAPDIAGPLAGLASALDWAADEGCDRVLVIPCDMPFLPVDLAGRLAANLTPGIGAVMAASGGRRHPACALWRSSVRPLLTRQVHEGRFSLMALAERAGMAAVTWPDTARDLFANLNSPEDLTAAEAAMRAATAPWDKMTTRQMDIDVVM